MKTSETGITHSKYSIGDLIQHRLFDYRGVIVDIDPCFQLTDEWYEQVARSRPPKDEPWYQVLVHNATHTTYVAERNLEPDPSGKPIDHPMTDEIFTELRSGRYVIDEKVN